MLSSAITSKFALQSKSHAYHFGDRIFAWKSRSGVAIGAAAAIKRFVFNRDYTAAKIKLPRFEIFFQIAAVLYRGYIYLNLKIAAILNRG